MWCSKSDLYFVISEINPLLVQPLYTCFLFSKICLPSLIYCGRALLKMYGLMNGKRRELVGYEKGLGRWEELRWEKLCGCGWCFLMSLYSFRFIGGEVLDQLNFLI